MANPPTRRRSSIGWLFLSFRGRISRQVYWLAFGYMICVNAAIAMQVLGGEQYASFVWLAEALFPFVFLGTAYVQISVTTKRLHDLGYSGFLAIATFIPLINFLFAIGIGLLPGTSGPNAYGDVTDAPPA